MQKLRTAIGMVCSAKCQIAALSKRQRGRTWKDARQRRSHLPQRRRRRQLSAHPLVGAIKMDPVRAWQREADVARHEIVHESARSHLIAVKHSFADGPKIPLSR